MNGIFHKSRTSGIFAIVLIAVIIRLFGVSSPYIADESMWSETARYMHLGNFDPMMLDMKTNTVVPPNIGIPHPPLGTSMYFISTAFLGVTPTGMRVVPLIFGIGILLVSYLLSKRIYDQKTAIISLIFIAFSFYSVWGSLYIDIDGSILSFFMLSAIYCYVRFRESATDKSIWLYLAAASFGFALLTKYTAVLIVPIILLSEFIDYAKCRKASMMDVFGRLGPVASMLVIGAAIFSVYPILAYMTGKWGAFIHTFSYGRDTLLTDSIQTQVHTLSGIGISFAKNIFFLLQYATPLIPILALLSLRNRSGKENILFSWIVLFVLFYTFMVPGGGKARYLMILIPPLYILAARGFLSVADIDRRDAVYVVIISLASLGVIAALNSYGSTETFNFHNLGTQTLIDNGFLWYSGHGSFPFAIHIHSFIFVVVLSAILFAASFKKNFFRNAMLTLLAVSIAFNGCILFESFAPTVGPDYGATLRVIAQDYSSTTGRIYGINQFRNALNIYFGDERVDYSDPKMGRDAQGNLSWSEPEMKGTVIVIDAELMDNPLFMDSTGRYLDNECRLEKIYYSNKYPFGYIYNC